MDATERNSPARIATARRAVLNFREAVGRGDLTGDVIDDDGSQPALPQTEPVSFPLRRLKDPPADADDR